MIKTIIVDDEPLARQGLENILAGRDDVKIIASCTNGVDAIEKIERLLPELVFLDIQMPEVDGFEVIRQLDLSPAPLFIFVTAFDCFAIDAFRVHALDYLLKPVKAAEIYQAVNRAAEILKLQTHQEQASRIRQLLSDLPAKPFLQRLVIRGTRALEVVAVNDILWLESRGDYISIHTAKKSYLHRETMTALLSQLDPKIFCRIHRSSAVALHFVHKLLPLSNGDYEIQLQNGRRLSLSRTYRSAFLEQLHA